MPTGRRAGGGRRTATAAVGRGQPWPLCPVYRPRARRVGGSRGSLADAARSLDCWRGVAARPLGIATQLPACSVSAVVRAGPSAARTTAPSGARPPAAPAADGSAALRRVSLAAARWRSAATAHRPATRATPRRTAASSHLQVLGPQPHPRVARQLGVVGDDAHLGVVEQRVGVEVRRADDQPAVVDDRHLGVDVDRIGPAPATAKARGSSPPASARHRRRRRSARRPGRACPRRRCWPWPAAG